VDLLTNPIWHALGGPQAAFAESKDRARRFRTDISPFAALPDTPDGDDWEAMRTLVGPGATAFVVRERVAIPDGWETTFSLTAVQMVFEGEPEPDAIAAQHLTRADVPDMLDLVGRTQPGPFLPGTIELGRYLGVRVDGALIAMAGERLRPPGYTEVSAVCTDPAFRGRGFATSLTRSVIAGIAARGDRPILHAAAENAGAIELYERLGFRHRRDVVGVGLRAPT
jgi:ribosomal protein S18 acetylase RimI-like enzyme